MNSLKCEGRGCTKVCKTRSGYTLHIKSCAKYRAWKLELDELEQSMEVPGSDNKVLQSDIEQPSQKQKHTDDSKIRNDEDSSIIESDFIVDHFDMDHAALPQFLEGSSRDGLASVSGGANNANLVRNITSSCYLSFTNKLQAPTLSASGYAPHRRSLRNVRFPAKRYADYLPSQPSALLNLIPQPVRGPPPASNDSSSGVLNSEVLPPAEANLEMGPADIAADIDIAPVRVPFITPCNDMGVYCIYPDLPSHEPNQHITLDDLNNAVPLVNSPIQSNEDPLSATTSTVNTNPYAPYDNASIWLLMEWMNNKSNVKSIVQIHLLVREVILSPLFNIVSLRQFSVGAESCKLDRFLNSSPEPMYSSLEIQSMVESTPFCPTNGWKEETIEIRLPHAGVELDSEANAPPLTVFQACISDL